MATTTTLLNKKKIFSGPSIYVDLSYEHSRSNANMIYKIYYKVYMADYPGSDYYNNKLQIKIYLNGSEVHTDTSGNTGTTQVKLNGNTGNKTVSNKTSGTTPLYITVKDTQNSSWVNYTSDTFNLTVDPAYPNISTFTLTSIDEQSIRVNWAADCTIDLVERELNGGSWTTVTSNANASSGSFVLSGLNAGAYEQVRIRLQRKSTNLKTTSGYKNIYTYEHPKVISANTFTIGGWSESIPGSIDPVINLYNPLGRTVTVNLKKQGTNTIIGTYTGAINGNIVNEFKDASAIQAQYESIPNDEEAEYYAQVVWGSGPNDYTSYDPSPSPKYKIAHSDAEKPDFDVSCITNIVNDLHTDIVNSNSIGIEDHNSYSLTISTHMVPKNSANRSKYIVSTYNGDIIVNYTDDNPITINDIVVKDIISIQAVDSRGNTKSVTITPDILPYSNPYYISAEVRRVDAITDKMRISVSGFLSIFDNNKIQTGKQNKITKIEFRYKKSEDQSYSNWETLTPTQYGNDIVYSGNLFVLDNYALSTSLIFDTTKQYNFEFRLSDELEDVLSVFSTTVGAALGFIWKDLANRRVGINIDHAPNNTLEVNGDFNAKEIQVYGGDIVRYNGGSGYDVNASNDWIHRSNDSSHSWCIKDHSGNVLWQYYPELGIAETKQFDASDRVSIPKNPNDGYGLTNSDGVSIIKDHNNQNVTVDATGDGLYLGFKNTTRLDILKGSWQIDANKHIISSVGCEVLWSGAYYMTATHRINLSRNISTCMNGIIIHMQGYNTSTGQPANYDHGYAFVSKQHVKNYNGGGVGIMCIGASGIAHTKYLYIYDDHIMGHNNNGGATYVVSEVIAV